MKSRSIRTLAVLASAGLIVGAFAAGPADAAKKKKKKPPVCAPLATHDKAKEAELVKVTDAATAEAPIEVALETGPGLGLGRPGSTLGPVPIGDRVSEAFVNVQVDSAAPSAGLYATIEFNQAFDYDLYLDDATGTEVAHSAGFFNQSSTAGAAGHSAPGSENIEGLETADCGGYAADVVGSITPGGEVTLKLWLGEIQAAPAE
ncbi:MAG: hypothetical protein ACLGIB_01475 [Actinomycetota bacterium]